MVVCHVWDPWTGRNTITHFTLNTLDLIDKDSWIVDSRATSHMCANPNLFDTHAPTTNPSPVYLLDGTIKMVHHIRTVN